LDPLANRDIGAIDGGVRPRASPRASISEVCDRQSLARAIRQVRGGQMERQDVMESNAPGLEFEEDRAPQQLLNFVKWVPSHDNIGVGYPAKLV
jgi:hypothetical protein